MDADEYLTPELVAGDFRKITKTGRSITGINLKRQVHFMGKWIKHGGYLSYISPTFMADWLCEDRTALDG
jgi:hypothetical protein